TRSRASRRRSSRHGRGGSGSPASAPSARSGTHGSRTAPSGWTRHDGSAVKIAILAPAWFAVPPTGYGGLERVVPLLADRLGEPGEIYELIAQVAPQVGLISISMNQRQPMPRLNWIANCPNALDFSVYPCKPHRGDYLLFLGRLSPDKGAHRAVAVAMETGLPLKLAGKLQEQKEREYFHELVEPHLVDGIEYLGEVTHGEKVELLQNARATLFPIEWE